jgi:hypothetical protein
LRFGRNVSMLPLGMGAAFVFLVCTGTFVVLTVALNAVSRGLKEEAVVRRRLRRFPRVRLSAARPGDARVTGRVIAVGDPLHAPLTGRPCVYHEVQLRVAYQWVKDRLDAYQGGGMSLAEALKDAGRSESTTVKLRAGRAFEIDDGTGRARVVLPEPRVLVPGKPPEMEIDSSIPPSHHVYGFKEKIPPDLARLANEAGAVAETPQAMEGDEGIVAAGDIVTVGGRLADETGADASADSSRSGRARWVLTGEPLILVKNEPPQ